jgi:tetratricopeptide (TPR) repeat protein
LLSPSNFNNNLDVDVFRASIYSSRAHCHKQLDHHQHVIQESNTALEILRDITTEEVNALRLKTLIRRGLAYEAIANWNRALGDFHRALSIDRSTTIAAQAVSRITSLAREHNKHQANDMKTKGNTFYCKNEYAEAIHAYNQALQLCVIEPKVENLSCNRLSI